MAANLRSSVVTPIIFGIEQSLRFNFLNIFVMFCDCCFFVDSAHFMMQNKEDFRIKCLFQASWRAKVDLLVHISSIVCLFVPFIFLVIGLNGRPLAWFSLVRMVSCFFRIERCSWES